MKAMVLHQPGEALRPEEREIPEPGEHQILIKIKACGVCRTDLHVVDGDLPDTKLPIIPGHEVIGWVEQTGPGVSNWQKGDQVGAPWLGYTCGKCKFCQREQENLCENALFNGYTRDGGYAEYMTAFADYCLPIPDQYFNAESTPLLCAGLIGYRSYRKTEPGKVKRLGMYGFGASAHLLAQLAVHEGKEVYAFTREGDIQGQEFARSLGCHWAGPSTQQPSEKLDAAIVFAPVGPLMVEALKATDKGGRVVSAGIHMSPIPEFEYKYLWGERSLHSVANLDRKDGQEFMKKAPEAGIETTVKVYPLEEANQALDDLRNGRLQGAAVLEVG